MTETAVSATPASDMLAELADVKRQRTALDERRDQLINALMGSKARIPRAEIAAAAGIREARLYQIAPAGRKPWASPLLISPMLPELHADDLDGVPPFEGGADTELVELIAARINEPRRRLMSEWGILAFVRAIRDEFPDGTFDPADQQQQDAVAKRVGYTAGNVRLAMSRMVMEGFARFT